MLRSVGRRLQGVPYNGNPNAHAQSIDTYRWQVRNRRPGMPRKDRSDMTEIRTVYESKHSQVFCRTFCNAFQSNQYLLYEKHSKECVLIDVADDWPDDWVNLIESAGMTLKFVFFTHLHIDNLVGLHPFVHMRSAKKLETFFAYNPSDICWMERFRKVADRYGRHDIMNVQQPIPRPGRFRPNNAQGFEGKADLLLDCASRRSESFFFMGNTPCQYVHTPGHSPGHMVLVVPSERLFFSGDLLFRGSIGRVDLPWACGDNLAFSLRMFEDMSDDTSILAGHGPLTTFGWERRNNNGLRRVYELMESGFDSPRVGTNEGGYF